MNNIRRGAGEGYFLFALVMLILLFVQLDHMKKDPRAVAPGMFATVKASSMRVYVVEWTGSNVRCRLDNGPDTAPRYQEMVFRTEELIPIVEVEKK